MLSVGAIHFEDRFCASIKDRIGGGWQVSAWGAVHMAAALVGTGLAISLLFDTNERRSGSSASLGAPFLAL